MPPGHLTLTLTATHLTTQLELAYNFFVSTHILTTLQSCDHTVHNNDQATIILIVGILYSRKVWRGESLANLANPL